jgi:hypothetical protein
VEHPDSTNVFVSLFLNLNENKAVFKSEKLIAPEG